MGVVLVGGFGDGGGVFLMAISCSKNIAFTCSTMSKHNIIRGERGVPADDLSEYRVGGDSSFRGHRRFSGASGGEHRCCVGGGCHRSPGEHLRADAIFEDGANPLRSRGQLSVARGPFARGP